MKKYNTKRVTVTNDLELIKEIELIEAQTGRKVEHIIYLGANPFEMYQIVYSEEV